MLTTFPGNPPTPAPGGKVDPVAITLILLVAFVPAMLVFFRLGLRQLVVWFEAKGRRP